MNRKNWIRLLCTALAVLLFAAGSGVSFANSSDLSHLPALLPNNVIPQHIGQFHRLTIAQATAFQLI